MEDRGGRKVMACGHVAVLHSANQIETGRLPSAALRFS